MYNQLFETAQGFTFVMVGNLDPDTLKPLIEQYIASLPAEKPALAWKDRSPKFPEGITDTEVFAGAEHKSMVAIMMKSPFEWSADNRLNLEMMMRVLNIKLRENLREDQGGVYGVGSRQSNSQFPTPEYTITINWGTNPEMVDTLTKAVFYEMDRLIHEGPTAEDLVKVKETTIRERETNEKQNRFWLNTISFADQNELPLLTIDEFNKKIHALTADDIQQAANYFLKPDHYLRLVLKPEAMKSE
jgi:zinc protease